MAECGEEQGACFRDVAFKAGLELVALLVLIIPMAYIYVFTSGTYEPFHRGFYCDDQNLKHPYSEQTVPIALAVGLWAAVCVFFIIVVETLRSLAEKGSRPWRKPFRNNRTPWIAVELYRQFGYFTLGALTTLLFTELAKYTIGRLRPHYLTVCNPELTDELCKDEFGYQKFVTRPEAEICRGLSEGTATEKQLHEARLSFLSGHSSFSFYCGMFLIVYLQARLSNLPACSYTPVRIACRSLKILRPFIQFAIIILAFWISLTRISDYFHHPFDVVTGALVGISFALITLTVAADIFNKRSAFGKMFSSLSSSSAGKTQLEPSEPRFRQLRDTEPLEMQGGVAGTKYESRSKTTIQYTSTANK